MAYIDSLTAAHRFGLGARFDELGNIAPDPVTWLNAQLTDLSSTLDGYNLISSTDGVKLFFDYQAAKKDEENGTQGAAAAPVGKQTGKDRFGAFFAAVDEITRTGKMVVDPVSNTDTRTALSGTPVSKAETASTLPSEQILEQIYSAYLQDISVRTLHATVTPGSFRERLVRFWSDHFSVDFDKTLLMVPVAVTMEREAIRPHVTGKFYDMLVAVERH